MQTWHGAFKIGTQPKVTSSSVFFELHRQILKLELVLQCLFFCCSFLFQKATQGKSFLNVYCGMLQGMMLNLIRYKKPCTFQMPNQNGGSPIERSSIEKRIEVLRETCERNSSLLTEVNKLMSSL
jgi:hypothetical protein